MSLYREARERRVLAALRRAAEAGEPCPSNLELEVEVGVQAGRIALMLDGLIARRLIAVERSRRGMRRVTILAAAPSTELRTGTMRTGWTRQARADPLRTIEEGPRLSDGEIAARRIDREPCPRCGVRADIGCRHGGAGGAAHG